MSWLIEILGDYFGWLSIRKANKELDRGNKTRALILVILSIVVVVVVAIVELAAIF